jgi:hypothetical protein
MKIAKTTAQLLAGELSVGEDTSDWQEDWFDGEPALIFKLIQSELIDTSRWSNIHEVIYQDLTSNKFYSSTYSVGATECQDERAYENDSDEIELTEVFAKSKVVTVYETK